MGATRIPIPLEESPTINLIEEDCMLDKIGELISTLEDLERTKGENKDLKENVSKLKEQVKKLRDKHKEVNEQLEQSNRTITGLKVHKLKKRKELRNVLM